MSAAPTFLDPIRRTTPLVVAADDDEDILAMVVMRLQRSGFDVVPARDGVQALELIRRLEPDLAVLDVRMPNLTGIGVVEAVRSEPALRSVRIILLTASASDTDVDRGLQAGADAYITKPFSPQDLATRAEEMLL